MLTRIVDAGCPRRWETALLLVGWCGVALVLFVAAPSTLSDINCDLAHSNFGELEWTVLPPGPTCIYTDAANGVDAEERFWSYSLAVLGLVVSVPVLVRWVRHPRPRQRRQQSVAA